MSFESSFLKEISSRGFIHQGTHLNELDSFMSRTSIIGYIGFDATAPSLHVGNLISLMLLKWFKKTGNQVILLLGGITTKFGDPSGKDKERPQLSEKEIQTNIESIQRVLNNFFRYDDLNIIILNNQDWLSKLNYVEFLVKYGKYFTVNRMISHDSVQIRMERNQSISFLEFNYMLLQAYDFLYLHNEYGCDLQIGGSDQWGNIINGIELIYKIKKKKVFGLTTPLMTNDDGSKIGKSCNKTSIWLSKDLNSSYEYWQFWRNSPDNVIGRYLRIFTELPLNEINRLEKLKDHEINEAKKILANEATSLIYGKECLESIHQTVDLLFNTNTIREKKYNEENISQIISLNGERKILEVLKISGLIGSNNQGRRLIKEGSIYLNGEVLKEENFVISDQDFTLSNKAKLSFGKKKHILLNP